MTHHAYYVEGLLSSFDAHKVALKPFWAQAYERFGVDEARELINLATLKNVADGVFFIGASSVTSEAQQALLKLFEEPQIGTTFVLLIPHGALLPTLKSRMLPHPALSAPSVQKLSPVTEDSSLYKGEGRKFLKMGGKERSDFITKLLKEDEGVKDRVRDFINQLEVVLVGSGIPKKETREALEDIAMVRDYVGDRAPSLKMLLEHLALSVPQI